MALPCANTCGRFRDGCHKACPRWEARQRAEQRERERKKTYLRDSRVLCAEVERQWYRAFAAVHR